MAARKEELCGVERPNIRLALDHFASCLPQSRCRKPNWERNVSQKALAVRGSSRAVHKIITKETSVPEGQALEGAFCVNVRVIRRTADSVKAAPTAFVQNKAEYNEI